MNMLVLLLMLISELILLVLTVLLLVLRGFVIQLLYIQTFFDIRAARPMPLYSVPGLIDHF